MGEVRWIVIWGKRGDQERKKRRGRTGGKHFESESKSAQAGIAKTRTLVFESESALGPDSNWRQETRIQIACRLSNASEKAQMSSACIKAKAQKSKIKHN